MPSSHSPPGRPANAPAPGPQEDASTVDLLRQSERRYRSLVEALPDLFFRLSRSGLHLDAHASDPGQLPAPLDAIVGFTVHERMPRPVAEQWMEAIEAAIDTEALREITYALPARDGTLHHYEARIVPVGPDEVQAIVRDVTRPRTTERALLVSESRFRSFVEATTQIVWIANAEGDVTVLPTDADGDPVHEPDGPWTDALHPEDCDAVLAAWDDHVAAGTPFEAECRVRRGGGYRWLAVRAVPVLDAGGAPAEWIGTCTDVTERREGAQAVDRARRHYHRLINGLEGVVWEGHVDKQTGDVRFTFISDQLQHLLGYAPETWRQDPSRWADAIVEEDRDRVLSTSIASLLTRPAVDPEERLIVNEYRVRTVDGRTVWLRDIVSVLEDSSEGARVVGLAIDVTDRKQYEETLREARREAEAAMQLQASFLNNMSHEIRTPLTTIIGFADLLAEEATAADREMVRMIQDGGRRLLITLNSVLDLARLESGTAQLEMQPLDVVAEAAAVVRLFGRQAGEKGLTLTLDAPEPAVAVADGGALQRVLLNLVSNAIKFTEEGGITVRVRVREADGEVVVAIEDSGIGMDAAFVEAAFEPFRQESEGLARHHQGSGLGLTIVRQLMTLMRGRVDVTSEKDVGSTFRIHLPHAQDSVPRTAPTVPAPRDDAHATRRASLLVVEDDASTRRLLHILLRDRYEVDAAATAEEALARYGPYDAVLLDINLPGGWSGVDLLRELRLRSAYADVPFVAVTAQALPGDRDRMLKAGFDAYLSKPFRRNDLVEIVREVMT